MSLFDRPDPQPLAARGRVTTLGMLIIDHFEAGDEADRDSVPPTLGGGGMYAMSAARMFLPAANVGAIIDTGDDFPSTFRDQLEALGSDMLWFRPRDGKTTRALNHYSGSTVGEGHQSFTYLSPSLQLWPRDYLAPPSPFATPPLSEWMHVVCDAVRAGPILDEADGFRRQGWTGKLAWEPLLRPDQSHPLSAYVALARRFAVFSPNHLELQTLLNEPDDDVETCARMFHGHLVATPGPVPAIVVRAGKHGAFTLSPEWTGWVPAFWQEGDHVVDVTGGGNAFMGGLLAGLLLADGDYRAASIYASTAASFAIEQRGLPTLSTSPRYELWNGTFVWDRLRSMARRVGDDDDG